MPVVQPGFLRSKLAEEAPENGKEIEYLMEVTKKLIFPGVMNWQSPKFLGYYPSSVNVTSIFAEMFATTFQTPGFINHDVLLLLLNWRTSWLIGAPKPWDCLNFSY
jgi:aromatic-L-amino-acid decarboxylase